MKAAHWTNELVALDSLFFENQAHFLHWTDFGGRVRYLNGKDRNHSVVKRDRIRTKEEFITELKHLSAFDRNYLNYNYLRKIKRYDLLFEAIKLFGGWRNALLVVGFQPIQKSWTTDEIISNIKLMASKLGRPPKSKEALRLGYSGLANAVNRRFGNWTDALIAAGFKPHRLNITKDQSILMLRKIAENLCHSPSMRELKQSNNYPLLAAGLKYFGTYNVFLKSAGLSIVLDMNKWPKSRIISELLSVAEQLGRSPTRTELVVMKRYDLINAVEKYLGSWSDGLIQAGLIPNKDVLNDDTTWRFWEELIFNILDCQNISYIKHMYIKSVGYPDIYIPSEKKIIEIKLNCSDNSVKKDIGKYLPYCEKLELWYLYGRHFGILSNKVSFVGPNHIREMLKDNHSLLERFNKIQRREIHVQQKPRKVLVLGSGAHYTTV